MGSPSFADYANSARQRILKFGDCLTRQWHVRHLWLGYPDGVQLKRSLQAMRIHDSPAEAESGPSARPDFEMSKRSVPVLFLSAIEVINV